VDHGRHQLAEIYLERENEYTLAGRFIKPGHAVLPGMQSAFVDIGLERDAFLYVSRFMIWKQQDEDLMKRSRQSSGDEARPRTARRRVARQ